MKKEFASQLFSYLFLIIFFMKMLISITPLLGEHIDSKTINAVIMQLELENYSTKSTDQIKELLNKGEWLNGLYKFNFCLPTKVISFQHYARMKSSQIQAFYPSVLTPPPNSEFLF